MSEFYRGFHRRVPLQVPVAFNVAAFAESLLLLGQPEI